MNKTARTASAAAVLAVVAAAVLAYAGAGAGGGDPPAPDGAPPAPADIVMPVKSSRPGCEEDDLCYVPSVLAAAPGEPVSWLNGDSAFHSVTSGEYGAPTGVFDSGYMDPGDVFWHEFGEPGSYQYHCTLHEWMRGTVVVAATLAESER